MNYLWQFQKNENLSEINSNVNIILELIEQLCLDLDEYSAKNILRKFFTGVYLCNYYFSELSLFKFNTLQFLECLYTFFEFLEKDIH